MDKLTAILAQAVKAGMEALPDSEYYRYCWDECTTQEQDWVKKVRVQLSKALALYEKKAGTTKEPKEGTG